jgi:dynein heavy chain
MFPSFHQENTKTAQTEIHSSSLFQIFEEHRQIYTFEATWSPEQYGSERHTAKQFREDLARQREWRLELDRMKVGNSIGVLHIDSKSLRNSLLPITARTLDAVKVVLLTAAREETVTVLGAFQQRIRALQDRPEQLDAFVDFMKLLEEMGELKKAAMAEVGQAF